uniref:FBD domain-containing protein n=1 Tax=Fagus sylvatica TaxID=28930 RepID=A0A2N9ISV6_FAGSY
MSSMCAIQCPVRGMDAIKCPHQYLKVVEFLGYCGRICDVEFVLYFIKNAVALEKILIDPYDQIVKNSAFQTANINQEQIARSRAKCQLEDKVPPSIELVIL